eukprot:8497881-Pyramimonas_sp.AAC.1
MARCGSGSAQRDWSAGKTNLAIFCCAERCNPPVLRSWPGASVGAPAQFSAKLRVCTWRLCLGTLLAHQRS